MKLLNDIMQKNSPYIKHYRYMDEIIKKENVEDIRMYFSRELGLNQNPHIYNQPSNLGEMDIPEGQGVISAVFLRDNDDLPPKNNFLIYPRHIRKSAKYFI